MRPKSFNPQSEDALEDWIISYADLVTILLCFFILFFSETVKNSSDEVIEAIAKVFTTESVGKADPTNAMSSHQISRDNAKMLASIESGFDTKMKGLEEFSLNYGIERKRKELLIRIWGSNFFKSGSWELTSEGSQTLEVLSEQLKIYNKKVNIVIEAHTDSISPKGTKSFLNNLELSSLRATSAANSLILSGFDENFLQTLGLGASRPLHKEVDIDGMFLSEKAALNRRVEIRILPLENR